MLTDTFNEKIFATLTEENQKKVTIIYKLAVLLKEKTPNITIDEQDFDELYDMPENKLVDYYHNMRLRLTGSRF